MLAGESAPTWRGVELIHRIAQPDPERRLDLTRLACHQERVESLERLYVPTSGRGRQSLGGQPGDNPVDVIWCDFPGRTPTGGQEPFKRARAVGDAHPAEPAGDLGGLVAGQANLLESQRIDHRTDPGRRARRSTRHQTKPVPRHAHLLSTRKMKASPYER